MKLVWARYGDFRNGKYDLYIILGVYDKKIVCLKSALVPDDIIQIIKARDKNLDMLPLVRIIDWLKKIWPMYGNAYREIHEHNLLIEKQYDI